MLINHLVHKPHLHYTLVTPIIAWEGVANNATGLPYSKKREVRPDFHVYGVIQNKEGSANPISVITSWAAAGRVVLKERMEDIALSGCLW